MARPLEQAEFESLRDLISGKVGLYFPDEHAYLVARRLLPRLQALGLAGFSDYQDYLCNAALPERERQDEWQAAFEQLATRETYFLRERHQLDALRDDLLPRLHRAHRTDKRLRILSAGCSTGEEVYTLAAVLAETDLFSGWDVQVVGADLSALALFRAEQALYQASSFRAAPDAWIQRHFCKTAAGWLVNPAVRRLCSFLLVNLSQPSSTWPTGLLDGPFDVIFCRNVQIYFPQAQREHLLTGLCQRMTDAGVLFLGHAELLRSTSLPLVLDRAGGEICYRHIASPAAVAVPVSLPPTDRQRPESEQRS